MDALRAEEKKWLAGYLPSGACLLCFDGFGTTEHRLCSCIGVVQALDWARAVGWVWSEAPELADADLAPLRLMGWLPSQLERVLVPAQRVQGSQCPGRIGRYCGDGSCM